MIKVEIPEEAFWGAIGFCAMVTAASLIRFLRWQGIVMTKPEHAKICEKQQKVTTDKLDEIKTVLEAQDATSSTWRTTFDDKLDKVKDDVGKLTTDVRVLQATQPANLQVNVKGS